MHAQSVNYPSAESVGVLGQPMMLSKNAAKEDLFAGDEVLHEYPDMPQSKTKFIKSVDEGTFTRMKQSTQNNNTAVIKERGSSHNTIEHVSASQLNPF